jgi:acetyl-CoA C-acetyltransferase
MRWQDVDVYAVLSQERLPGPRTRADSNSVVPVKDVTGITILAKDEHTRLGTTTLSLAQLQPSFSTMGAMGPNTDGARIWYAIAPAI